MSQQVISYADLSIINGAIRAINSNISSINTEVTSINFKQDHLESELEKLAGSFSAFVEADIKHKALQLAETRVGNVKQDLQIKYGYYADVRRMATGMLQGVDVGVVGNETLRSATEEVMIKAPGYWLAPALVALASWIRSDQVNTAKALAESLKRDDYRSTLFFMLVMRRLNRNEASLKWLERYFLHQNPHHLDREFIIILEAVTTGVFPPASKQLMMKNVKDWLNQLSQSANFVDEQRQQWVKMFIASGPSMHDFFPLLQKFGGNYKAVEKTLRAAKTYALLIVHFRNIISSSADLSIGVKVQLDEILSLLVTNFDEEELPLQKQVRLNELIIEMDGDKKAAQAKMNTEDHIFDEKVDFLQLLTNAAFNPELSGATKVTQALAVSISQPWIVEAHDQFTVNNRSKVPQSVELKIDGFSAAVVDGTDEDDHLNQQGFFYDQELKAGLERIPFPYPGIIMGALIAILGIWLLASDYSLVGVIALGIGAVISWSTLTNFNRAKKTFTDQLEERRRKGREVLRGCIAEIVDYRNEYAEEDSKAEELREILTSITPEDFSSVSKESARSITLN